MRIFQKIWLIKEIVFCYRDKRRCVPSMQMHPDLTGITPENILPKILKLWTCCHLVVSEVACLKTVGFAQSLKARKKGCIICCNVVGFRPEIIPFGVDGN